MSAVLEDEEETEEQRYQRFFGPAESSTEDDESRTRRKRHRRHRGSPSSEASALLAKLIGEVLAEAKTRPERETARLACAAAGSFLAQIPGAAGAFEGEASREDVLAEGPSATLCVARGARFTALDELNDAPPPPVDAGAAWACLVGRPWPVPSERPARARRYVLAVRRGVVERDADELRRARETGRQPAITALCRCVDAPAAAASTRRGAGPAPGRRRRRRARGTRRSRTSSPSNRCGRSRHDDPRAAALGQHPACAPLSRRGSDGRRRSGGAANLALGTDEETRVELGLLQRRLCVHGMQCRQDTTGSPYLMRRSSSLGDEPVVEAEPEGGRMKFARGRT